QRANEDYQSTGGLRFAPTSGYYLGNPSGCLLLAKAQSDLTMYEQNSDTKREMLRHTVATLAYRGAKAVRGTDDSFASFKASETTRTPMQILAHIGDLLDWALSIAKGAETWNNSEPLSWPQEVTRFHAALASFDDYLASDN